MIGLSKNSENRQNLNWLVMLKVRLDQHHLNKSITITTKDWPGFLEFSSLSILVHAAEKKELVKFCEPGISYIQCTNQSVTSTSPRHTMCIWHPPLFLRSREFGFDFRTAAGMGNLTPSCRRWGIWLFVHNEWRENVKGFSRQDIVFVTEWLTKNGL